MIFITLFSFLSFFFNNLKASEIPIESSSEIKIKFEDLCDDLLIRIATHFHCHTIQFGRLNRRFHQLFTIEYNYARAVFERFGVPAFCQFKNGADLKFFKEIRFTPDYIDMFHMLHNNLLNYGTFKENIRPIAFQVLSASKTLPPDHVNNPSRKAIFQELDTNLMKFLIKKNAYDSIIKIMQEFPENFTNGIEPFNFKSARYLLNYLKLFVKEERSELVNMLYTRIKAAPKRNRHFSHALFSSLSPDFINSDVFNGLQEDLENDFIHFLSVFPLNLEFKRITRRITRYAQKFNNSQLIQNLISIRLNENEIHPMENLSGFDSFVMFIAASTAKKQNLFDSLVQVYAPAILEQMQLHKDFVTVKSIIDLNPRLTRDRFDELLNFDDHVFMKLLLTQTACGSIDIDEEDDAQRYIVEMTSSPKLVNLGAPETFEINTSIDPYSLFTMAVYFHEDSMVSFLGKVLDEDQDLFGDFEQWQYRCNEQIYRKILFSDALKALEFDSFFHKLFIFDISTVAEIIKLLGKKKELRVFCSDFEDEVPHFTQYLISKLSTSYEFIIMEKHCHASILELMNTGLSADVHYGEIRSAFIYIMGSKRERRRLLHPFASVEFLRKFAIEYPDEIRALRPDIFEENVPETTETPVAALMTEFPAPDASNAFSDDGSIDPYFEGSSLSDSENSEDFEDADDS